MPRGRNCARHAWLAGACLQRLLDGGRPGVASLSSQRARHDARLCLTSTTSRYREPEATHGLGAHPLVHHITDSFDIDFGVGEWHGHNAFIRDGERIFRTYFINDRGDEAIGTVWSFLDMTALGRQELWEDSPEGYPQERSYKWWNWHDSYVPNAAPDPEWVKVSDAGEATFRKQGE